MNVDAAAGAGPASSNGWAGPESRRVELDKIFPFPLYDPGSRMIRNTATRASVSRGGSVASTM